MKSRRRRATARTRLLFEVVSSPFPTLPSPSAYRSCAQFRLNPMQCIAGTILAKTTKERRPIRRKEVLRPAASNFLPIFLFLATCPSISFSRIRNQKINSANCRYCVFSPFFTICVLSDVITRQLAPNQTCSPLISSFLDIYNGEKTHTIKRLLPTKPLMPTRMSSRQTSPLEHKLLLGVLPRFAVLELFHRSCALWQERLPSHL